MHQKLVAEINQQLDQLLAKHRLLEAENQQLKQAQRQWLEERQRLIEKNALACNRIEAMISRLKGLEMPAP
jgi:cell division protein ZapB